MIPRRTQNLTRLLRPGPSRLRPRFLHHSPSHSAPAAQLAEREEVDYHHTPPAFTQQDPTFRRLTSEYPSTSYSALQLPSPLPSDIAPDADPFASSLYPSTGVIDSLSMISICLRRSAHIPRAYQIFKNLIEDSKTGMRRTPDAEVWGRVIQGVASLGKRGDSSDETWKQWRTRAEVLVNQWEAANNVFKGSPALKNNGIKVYQGWLSGMISASTPLDHLQPYLRRSDFPLSSLLAGMEPSKLPLAYEALLSLARRTNTVQLEEQVRELQSIEKERREIQAREVVEEVKPVLESEGKTFSRKKAETEVESGQVRFTVSNLRKTLDVLNSPSIPINRQRALEQASMQAAHAELERSAKLLAQHNIEGSTILHRHKLQGWMYQWHMLLSERIKADIEVMRVKSEAKEARAEDLIKYQINGLNSEALLLYLTLLPPEKLSLITVLELMRMCGSGGISEGMKALRGILAVGKAVETEYRAETIKNVSGVDSPQWLKTIDPQTQRPSRALVGQIWRNLGKQVNAEKHGITAEEADEWRTVWTPSWSQNIHLGVGGYLTHALLDVAKVDRTARDQETGEEITESQPAFTHMYDYVRGKKLGVIKVNPVVGSRLAKDRIVTMVHPRHLPMLVPPRPWTGPREGGYLLHPVDIMRFKDSTEQQVYIEDAAAAKHLEPVFHGLDVLSSTPWAINRSVFDVVLKAWNSGEAIADIPAAEEKADYKLPDKPASTLDPHQRSLYVERVKAIMAQQRKDHGERCKFNYNIEIARSFLNDTFYLPHNMDFRGRAYPIPPHLNPVGDDLCRGLLTFGEKKALGETGLKWLHIHLANVYGYDKASFEERSRFAQDHVEDVFDSADRPLDGKRWWLQAEDPWQCLATCFELAGALRSPDPTAFESSLPIHQDGTCNGMQHYAALGGDVRGAKAVNLENGDRPADIYTGVADIVNKVIEEDKKAGKPVALMIPGPIGRKIVKQTVMTTVYGVTFIGARDQIGRQLVNRGDFAPEHIFVVSAYLAKTVLSCIGDLFSGAKAIMEWLTTSARLISRSIPPTRVEAAASFLEEGRGARARKQTRLQKEMMASVVWTTPLGLPVVQPYRKAVKKQVMTALQSVYISDPNAPSEVSPQKQSTAFPPNYIHSLDATHMLLTALQCRENKITFASVHDSYWTHASTVEHMSTLIRNTFIQLHSQDLIGELRKEFLDHYGEYRIPIHSAKSISTSAATRRKKEAERQKEIAAALELQGGPSSAVNGTEADPLKDSDSQGIDIEDDLEDNPDAELDMTSSNEPSSLGLTNDDLAELARRNHLSGVDEERINNQRFVKFKDLLPPCPPRGVFDVQRIRESAYFFS